jgi:MFS family permease
MAIYLLAYYIFQALSQLLLKIKFTEYWMAYILIASLAGLSIIPVMLAKKTAPITEHNKLISPKLFLRKAPFGVSAAVVAGLMFPMIYTMYPLLLAESGLNASQIADVMSVTLIGGALLQLPIGKISDRFDRRKILIALSIGTAVTGLLMAVSYQYYGLMLILSFILGGLVFGIYPVSVSHTSDCVGRLLSVAAVSVITLSYSVGSMFGPLAMSGLMSALGNMGFFVYIIASCALLGLYGIYYVLRQKNVEPNSKSD